METNIKIFENALFGQVRSIVDESSEPWFCLTDVCKALELQTTAVKNRLEGGVISIKGIPDSLGRTQQANFVNEDGLYDVILDSRKPEAKKFRKWITSEVLPSIRKDGGYLVTKKNESEDELVARAMALLQKRMEEMKAFHAQQELAIEQQKKVIAQMSPKGEYFDNVMQSKSTYTATQIAKEFGWGAKTLNEKLHALGIQYKMNGQWLLYTDYADKGYTKTLTYTYTDVDNVMHSSQSTVWTEKGRHFIHELMKRGNGSGEKH